MVFSGDPRILNSAKSCWKPLPVSSRRRLLSVSAKKSPPRSCIHMPGHFEPHDYKLGFPPDEPFLTFRLLSHLPRPGASGLMQQPHQPSHRRPSKVLLHTSAPDTLPKRYVCRQYGLGVSALQHWHLCCPSLPEPSPRKEDQPCLLVMAGSLVSGLSWHPREEPSPDFFLVCILHQSSTYLIPHSYLLCVPDPILLLCKYPNPDA